jgi:hypothetical protein
MSPMSGDKVVTITDSLGRTLKIKALDVVYESRLARMLGAEATSNPTYMMGFVLPAASIFEIDGVELAKPTTVQELEESIARLGREGIAAFMQHVQSEFAQVQQAVETAKSV